LRAYQKILPTIISRGASLAAISPQTPDHSQAMLLKNFLQYTVLSDIGNVVARQFGLVYPLSTKLRPIYQGLGIHLPAYNADESWELPLPGTFVIDRGGIIRLTYVDADYTRRLEPADILAALDGLSQG
jgi:peroxiredoxin